MPKRLSLASLALAATLALGGCMAALSPTFGVLFTDTKYSQDHAANPGPKTGRACAQSYLALIATGDASVSAAKAAGGINDVTDVTHEIKNYLGIYAEYCTVVRGR
jgi:hypothetical protein